MVHPVEKMKPGYPKLTAIMPAEVKRLIEFAADDKWGIGSIRERLVLFLNYGENALSVAVDDLDKIDRWEAQGVEWSYSVMTESHWAVMMNSLNEDFVSKVDRDFLESTMDNLILEVANRIFGKARLKRTGVENDRAT